MDESVLQHCQTIISLIRISTRETKLGPEIVCQACVSGRTLIKVITIGHHAGRLLNSPVKLGRRIRIMTFINWTWCFLL